MKFVIGCNLQKDTGKTSVMIEIELEPKVHFVVDSAMVPKRKTTGYVDLTSSGVEVVDSAVLESVRDDEGVRGVTVLYVAPIEEKDMVFSSLLPAHKDLGGCSLLEILEAIPERRF